MLEIIGNLFVWTCAAYIVWYAFADDILSRIAPMHAAKRRAKQAARLERQMERYRRPSAGKQDRVLEWAKNNPDHPVAQALMREKFDNSPEERLRKGQQFADEYERDSEAISARVERRNQEALEWALAHPDSPVGNRHLREKLIEARLYYNRASRSVDHSRRMLEFDHLEPAEREGHTADLSQALTELETAEQAVIEIEMALGVDALTDQQ